MAKRKPRKSKVNKTKAPRGIGQKRLLTLKKEAENTRRRISAFNRKYGTEYETYISVDTYSLNNILERISSGEKYSSILSELKNITSQSLKEQLTYKPSSQPSKDVSLEYKLAQAVDRANANIRQARKKYSEFLDIMPKEFSMSDLIGNYPTEEYINQKIDDLSLFTPENLIPTAINESGEAGTLAEYKYSRNILERENERRRELQAQNDPRTNAGYFLQQSDVDTAEINIDAIPDIKTLRKRAETWDDPARTYRANLFITNYLKSIDLFEASLINAGFYNDVVEERIDYIREIATSLLNNEKAIDFVSSRIPNIDITLMYEAVRGDIDFDSVYNAWIDVEDMFL